MFEVITSTSYWVLTVLCGAILWLCIGAFRQSKNTDKTVVVLLFILAIDAFRTLVESVYFGLYFNSMFGLLPAGIHNLLANPHLLIIPKLVNIIAGFLVLVLLIRYWMPRALRERAQQIEDLERAKLTAEKKMLEFESIFNSIPDAIVLTDLDRRITVVNSGLERIFGYTFNDLVGKKTAVLYEDNAEYERLGRVRFNMSAKENNDTYEVNCRRKNGQVFIGESLGTAVRGENGSILGFIGVMRDITQRKHNEDRLKFAASVFTHAREGIMVTDTDGTIIEVNDTFSLITGYDREEVLGNNPRLLKSGRQSPTFYVGLWNSLIENKHWSGELWNQHKNGEVYAVLTTISALCDAHGQAQHYVALFLEITDIKVQQQKLEQISHYDALTGLPNRVLLADRLRHAMNQCQRRGKSLVVAYLDLDDFKIINDSHGHNVGDELLIALSMRIKQVLREGDTLARLGGDEFVAVLVDIDQISDCQIVLSRLLEVIATPVIIGDLCLNVSASIGITFYPQNQVDADQLIRHADNAMYIAKQMGKNRYHLFDVDQNRAINIQSKSLEDIKFAIERSEFVLYYQPKVNMQSGEVIGAEALIRWQHPELGLMQPGEFLPITDNHPISVDIGNWVINAALAQMSDWQTAGLDIPVSVNVGAQQLLHKDFVINLSAALARYPKVKPSYLELEILETSALEDIAKVSMVMRACHDIGVSFALDDFGTGYSSLTHLKRLPADLLKIDQSFVRDMLVDADDRSIVTAVIALASTFKRQVIAEGVETAAHGAKLIAMGCVLAQGYGIARPMPAELMAGWIGNWKADPSWCVKTP